MIKLETPLLGGRGHAWLRRQYKLPDQVNQPWTPFRNQGKVGDPMAVGCSNTFGVGVDIDQTWHSLIERHYCIAQPGASLESIWRLLRHWITVVNPPLIRLLTPPMGRRECFMSDPVKKNYFKRYQAGRENVTIDEFEHETEIQLHQLRMLDAIRHCVGTIPIEIVTWEEVVLDVVDLGTDGQHPGPKSHKAIAEHFK